MNFPVCRMKILLHRKHVGFWNGHDWVEYKDHAMVFASAVDCLDFTTLAIHRPDQLEIYFWFEGCEEWDFGIPFGNLKK